MCTWLMPETEGRYITDIEERLGSDLPGFFVGHRCPWGSVSALCPKDWLDEDHPCPGLRADKRKKPSGNPPSGSPEGFPVRV